MTAGTLKIFLINDVIQDVKNCNLNSHNDILQVHDFLMVYK